MSATQHVLFENFSRLRENANQLTGARWFVTTEDRTAEALK
jgi:hypothetical protein